MHDIRSLVQAIKKDGYVRLEHFASEDLRNLISSECINLEQRHYTEANLRNKSVYPSDKSDSRISHAMMVTTTGSVMPHINIAGTKGLTFYTDFAKQLIETLKDSPLRPDARFLLNWQTYNQGSKPVMSHFDGEYFDFSVDNALGKIDITDAVVPKLVILMTIYNDGNPAVDSTILIDPETGNEIIPPAGAGDIIIFDNTRFWHRVDTVSAARRVIGLRCFDDDSFHFVKTMHLSIEHSLAYSPSRLGGFIAPVSDSQDFIAKRWDRLLKKTDKAPF